MTRFYLFVQQMAFYHASPQLQRGEVQFLLLTLTIWTLRRGYAECHGCILLLWVWLSIARLCEFFPHCPHNIQLKATERLLWSVSQWKKNIYLHRTGLCMYISLYEKLCDASTSMETLVFWAFLFGYEATHIFVPVNQLQSLEIRILAALFLCCSGAEKRRNKARTKSSKAPFE